MRVRFLIVGLGLILSACASPTPYQRNGLSGGYSEEQTGRRTWVVKVEGNIYTSPDRVQNMLILRAADLTLEQGFQYFRILGWFDVGNRMLSTVIPGTISSSTYGGTIVSGNIATTQMQTYGTVTPPSVWNPKPFPEGKIRIEMLETPEESAIDAKVSAAELRSIVVK